MQGYVWIKVYLDILSITENIAEENRLFAENVLKRVTHYRV